MNKKTKNFSDLSKKQKDKIISDCCEGANEEQAELLNSVNDDWIKKFIEQGAEIEHNRWSRWQSYLFSKSEWTKDGYLIPRELCFRWQKQIDTPYSELSEKEKESDKKEVENYLPILYELLEKIKYKDKIEETINSIMEILKEQIK
ncbi:MAG TPA: hypothetical protein PLF97_02685 [Candidatus Pacearchaeota archaeon]|jgi:hypothetical protein|nr:hypothetical protein [Candidatus Pacearchaeota archaeon]